MKSMQKGFSLIELMIVVAIIGILAAVAIPQYQNFLARSQFSEAHALLGSARTSIQERIDAGRTFTFANLGLQAQGQYGAITVTAADMDVDPAVTVAQTYSVQYVFGADTAGVASADANANPRITASIVEYTYTPATGLWDCVTTALEQFVSGECDTVLPAALIGRGVN